MGSKLGSSAAADTGNRGRGRNFRTCMLELDSLQHSVVFVKEGHGSPFMPGQTGLRNCGRRNALCHSLSGRHRFTCRASNRSCSPFTAFLIRLI